jgi:trimeric autotransporter adhesin
MRKTTFTTRKFFFAFIFLLFSFLGFGQSTQTYNTPGTYTFTVPSGIVSINIEVWGAGGAGGGATGNMSAGGGGAGGGYVKKLAMTVTPGTTYTVNVGSGGTGDKNSGNVGNPSWFGSTSTIYAVGGNGGALANNDNSYAVGATAVSSGNIGFSTIYSYYGGSGGDGIHGGGGGGSSAGTGSNGNMGINTTGGAAVTGGGQGADGSAVNGNGANGLTPGGGGAGATATGNKDKSGGNGANGQVIVSWVCPVFSLSSAPTVSTSCTTFGAVVSVNGTATSLPIGTYTVTYNLTGTNTAVGNTATMNVTTAGTGSFTTAALVSSGSTTVSITNLATSSCGNAIATNNSVITNIGLTPSITSTTPNSRTGTGTVALIAAASAGSVQWYDSATGGTLLITNTNYTTPSLSATTTYYVQATNGSCTSSPRIAVTATINNPEIAVSGNGININDGDTTTSTSDYTNLGSTNLLVGLTRTYTINNLGGAVLSIGTLTKTGTNASEFVVTGFPTTVAAQSSATFTITFTPTATGNRTANISFVNGDADENPFNFDISGTGNPGVTPEINLKGLGFDILDGASASSTTNDTDFGTPLTGVSVIKTFTIQNTGTGPLTLTGTPKVTITGDAAFTVSAQPSSGTIASGSSLTFQVTFNSAVTGNFLAIVSINNDDTNESTYDFVITALAKVSGVEIDIQGNDVSIVSGDTTPSTLDQTDFGITDAATPIKIPYQIYSYGSSNLTLTTTVTVTALTGTGFSASPILNATLPYTVGGATNYVTSFYVTFTPTATLGIRTARITVNSNDPNESSYTFIVQAEVQNATALTVAPGGVTTNLKFWIKADSKIGSLADSDDIVTWEDKTSGSTKNAVSKLGKEPKFLHNTTNNVNFNPVIHFNGANFMSGGQGFNNLDMFVVVKPTNSITYTSSALDTYCGDDVLSNKPTQDVTGFELGNTSVRFTNELLAYNQAANSSYGVGEISTTKSYTGVNIFNPRNNGTRMSVLNNGNTLTTTEVNTAAGATAYKNIVNSRYWIGASETFGPSYDGDFLEVINYSAANTITDRRKIESYLAIKYGITLGTNGTSLDYYNSASTNTATSIYAAGAGFNYNIAGIGRDDVSQLYQKQSKTENTISDITIGLGNIYDKNSDNPNTFVGDKNYLVWGNNNGTLLAQPAVTVNMSTGITPTLTTNVDFISVGRTWKVVETGGNVGSVKVSIPSTMLTSTITPPGDFLMFISSTSQFNPTSEYRVMKANGSNLETDFDFDGTKYITFGYAPERTYPRAIDFDGVNDYLDSGKVLDLNTSFTVSAWIKTNGINQTILSKRNNPFTAGYDLGINSSGKVEMSWINGTKQSIVSSIVFPTGIWHNVAVIYNGTTAKLYIDGIEDASEVLTNVPANPTQSFLIAAADGVTPASFFNGTIDEVRIWNVALSEKQLRYVMNQEILSNGTATNANSIPNTITSNDISAIPWANLSAYYPMSTYTFTNAKDVSNNNYTAALRNLTTVNKQTAPLPYESTADGYWQNSATWLNSSVQDIPNSVSISDDSQTIDWNIVKTTHNVVSEGNKTVLGLIVSSNTLTATTSGGSQTDGTKIEVSHYLKLDGKIDLVGRSQLIQTEGSDLDATSSGSIERDQQGQANKYNYNYWCSPVGTINSTSNNAAFTVGGVLKDGTIPSAPAAITWVSGYNGATSPFSIARYWIYKFDNLTNDYANWTQIGETGTLQAGKGFTLKGTGTSGTQNLTFVGKPNNGTISNPVASDQLLLTGNPYSSALDADDFITDNIGSIETSITDATIDGALYFWEHYATNNTHSLSGYQGGYAVRNLSGGVAPSSLGVNSINSSGVSTRPAPNRYIPVGQGFFVIGKNGSGGAVTFKNSQREFVKEDNTDSQIMYKVPVAPKGLSHWTDNRDATIEKDTYKRIRLGFNTLSETFHKQVLLAFMNDKADDKINPGYDAFNMDDSPSDLFLLNDENELSIQGEGYFDEEASFPIGIKNKADGKVSFVIDNLENFDSKQAIYIYDDETKTYHDIRTEAYELELPEGDNNTRFSLRFTDKNTDTDKNLGLEQPNSLNDIKVNFVQNTNLLTINNMMLDTVVEKITLYTITGQVVSSWKVDTQDQKNIKINITDKSTGIYITKIKTSNGVFSKKIIIK